MEEKLREQMMSLIKINNLTGFLPLSVEEMLEAVRNELDKAFGPYTCRFKLLGEPGTFCCHLPEPAQCKAFKDQLPIVIGPGQEHPCCMGAEYNGDCQWHICVPLVAGMEVLGVITLKSREDQPLARESMEIILAAANQLAATVQRARLINRLAQEKSSLELANREISQLNQKLQDTIAELEKAQAQLILTERLAAAGQLAANVAHEINNPIGVIIARLDLILMDAEIYNLPRELIEDLQVMKRHSERISRTTRGLLSFSRPPQTGVNLIDMESLIRDTVGWLEGQFSRKGIVFVLNLAPLGMVKGNGEELQQVLVNLLTNARDAMPRGGTITVQAKALSRGNMIRVDIIDTGVGIPEEHMEKLFDPFFTTKGKDLGTGLGLPISFRIIREHGGTIRVASQPGQGSRFSIFLPCQASDKGVVPSAETKDGDDH